MKSFVNGVNLAYEDIGKGPAVMLIHGFPLRRTMWRHQAKALVEAGYRVVLPDLRGFGESEVPDGPYSMDVFADDLAMLLAHLGIGKAVVGGMSMGGYILLNMLERHRTRIKAACFIVTRAGADEAAGKARRTELAHAVQEKGPAEVSQSFEAILFARETPLRNPTLVAEVSEWMLGTDPRGLAAGLLAMRDRRDYSSAIGIFDLPALVIKAGEDRAIPPAEADLLAAGLPRATLCTLEGGGHMVNLEQPEGFNACLLDFLRRVSPCQG
ncbi:MAG: alpha/beta hydrolase [Desulfuromonadales bacterium]|jgi:3-oxoadipate enol-lactonase